MNSKIRKQPRWFALAIVAVAADMAATVAFGQTPANGGMVGGTTIVIDNDPGDQIDPHVSGDLAAYTDQTSGTIRYFDFSNSQISSIPSVPDEVDTLSNVDGTRISFSRLRLIGGGRACMVFDVSNASTVEIAPGSDAGTYSTALGGDTVAFVNQAAGKGDIMVGSISAPLAPLVNLSASPDIDGSPAVSPAGTAVVWERCVEPFSHCWVMKSIFSGGSWGAAQVVSDGLALDQNPETDGTWVVYDSNRVGSLGGGDIYYQPLAGGAEIQLAIDGVQRNPSISQGVIAFESVAPGVAAADLFVYVVATNTVLQVTDTPGVDESLNDLTVLPSGDVRVVWAADDDLISFAHNIYARTFSLPANVVYNFDGFFRPVDNLPTLNLASAGSAIPVRFSLGGDQGLAIFAPGYPASSPIPCDASEPGAVIDETVSAGDSGLSYDAATDQYAYVWKTDKAWKGSCRMLILNFNDGSQHLAKFRFR